MKSQTINLENFEDIEYENNDVDTDRGTMRDRCFLIYFKNTTLTLGESDFSQLLNAMKKYDEGDEEQ